MSSAFAATATEAPEPTRSVNSSTLPRTLAEARNNLMPGCGLTV